MKFTLTNNDEGKAVVYIETSSGVLVCLPIESYEHHDDKTVFTVPTMDIFTFTPGELIEVRGGD